MSSWNCLNRPLIVRHRGHCAMRPRDCSDISASTQPAQRPHMHSVQAKHSLRILSLLQPAQYIWTGFENIGDESEERFCDGMMWKLLPD
jgi:hypothetical protein